MFPFPPDTQPSHTTAMGPMTDRDPLQEERQPIIVRPRPLSDDNPLGEDQRQLRYRHRYIAEREARRKCYRITVVVFVVFVIVLFIVLFFGLGKKGSGVTGVGENQTDQYHGKMDGGNSSQVVSRS